MVRFQLRTLPLSLVALVSVILVGTASASTARSAASPSPSAGSSAELICHTDNAAECYPKVFQPTDEFQLVRADQDLPSGLHVRLNVWTGEKEAKINVPDEEAAADQRAVVVVDPESQEEQQQQAPRIPANAPAYDPMGKIKEPPKQAPSEDSSSSVFSQSLAVLKKGLDVDSALEALEDISHDIYYGLKIAEDYDTVRRLVCLATATADNNKADADDATTTRNRRARLAALAISSAVQNNPKALSEIEKHWVNLKKEQCAGAASALGSAVFRVMEPRSDPAVAKARVAAVSGLLKNDAIRREFLAGGGMDLLLEVLAAGGSSEAAAAAVDWEPVQRKVALLLLDNFLDGDMGAALGEWPLGPAASDKACAEVAGSGSAEGGDCWDWYVKQLGQRYWSDKSHWSGELWSKLKEQRKANGSGKGRAAKTEL
ncbi:hypothetical protein B0T26DRAFT_658900 [Lasiosphaeria miniovina]|uniref:Nucleotide exchange factor SIL1 n=1 Tax=Lasiosphaeria miniovina TaxID=1954250 RepID=A0AA39ZU55_9PEZI|nr:uncharacterized protein B0T26DRAFT_658900 [Lasiosphaeria miniovina]KAK0703616.1 hypothetical protein B0T26DRAFT_658900 [Lasiosphaeria miniovina]